MATKVLYRFSFVTDNRFYDWYRETNLPFVPPVGMDVWIPNEPREESECSPVVVLSYDHWLWDRGHKHGEMFGITLGCDTANDEAFINCGWGSVEALCQTLAFHGWKEGYD